MSASNRGLWTYFWVYVAFLFIPLVVLAVFSFHNAPGLSLPWRGFTTRWYEQILATPTLMASMRTSIIVALFASTLSVALGTAVAIAVVRYRFPGRALIGTFSVVPLVFPYLAIAVALLVTFVSLGVRLSVPTIVIGHTIVAIPYTVIIVAARLAGIDRAMEEAALDLGASRIRILRRIYLPLAAPAIVSAFAASFIVSFDEFYLAFFLSGSDQTLPVYFFSGLRRAQLLPPTVALSTIVMVVTIAALALVEVYGARTRRGAAILPPRGPV
jgi:spermidine/putrescine transport system permease protein